jgi:hypothetical protein
MEIHVRSCCAIIIIFEKDVIKILKKKILDEALGLNATTYNGYCSNFFKKCR